MKQATGGGTPGTGERGAVTENARRNFGREAGRDPVPSLQSTSSAAATGGRVSSSRTPRPSAASLDARGSGNDNDIACKDERSLHRSNFSPERQRYRNDDSNTSPGIRRKSTGLDQSPPPLERGDGILRMSPNLTQFGSRRGDGGKGKGGAGGRGSFDRAASMPRDRPAIGNTSSRRASVPSWRAAGRFAQVDPAGKRLANVATSLSAAAEVAAARHRTSLDAWEEMAAGAVNADGVGWTLGGRTQGDYLLQQRARGGGTQTSRR